MSFFDGSVQEAIAASRRDCKPLIVLLTGFDQGSRQVQDALISLADQEWAAGSILLALEDDLASTDRSQFPDAKNFRAFCPVEALPSVVLVSPSGATLAKVTGVVPAAELAAPLADAFAAFREQQQRMLSAQAALLAASAAAAAGAGGAAGAAPTSAQQQGDEEDIYADLPPLAPEEDSIEEQQEQQEAAAARASSAAAAAAAPAAAAPAAVQEDIYADLPPLVPMEDGFEEQQQAVGSAASRAGAAATAPAAVAGPAGAAAARAAPAAAEEAPVDPADVPYRLQFKFTDATTLRADFTGASLLSDVFEAVDAARLASGRPPLAYVLVQAAPRRVLGAADEGLRLAESGVQPRTSLQVIPHASQGHRPPAPPEPEPEAAEGSAAGAREAAAAGADAEMAEAGAAAEQTAAAAAKGEAAGAVGMEVDTAAPAAPAVAAPVAAKQAASKPAAAAALPPQPKPQPPADIQLQVRLSNGDSLRRAFPPSTLLSAVLDWVDEERTDRGPYDLSVPYPKRSFAAEELGATLQELGLDARTSLKLDPKPPKSKDALSLQRRQQQRQAAAAAAVTLHVRLSNGDSLVKSFPPEARLYAVLDWVDAERTDRGAYRLMHPQEQRIFFSGDLSCSLEELGFRGRTQLSLELLPPKSKSGGGAQRPVVAAGAAEGKLPDMFELQFKLTDGGQLRGSFAPEATLQQVCHYLDTNRTDGGAPYTLVQPYPKRKFGPADMASPLLRLGLQPRQLLWLEGAAGGGGGTGGGRWSLGGALSAAASWLNPYAYLSSSGPAGTAGEAAPAGQEAAAAGPSSGPSTTLPVTAGSEQRGARKRALGGSNIHTLQRTSGDGPGEGGPDDGNNNYWNGNSTEFGGGPPPGQQ